MFLPESKGSYWMTCSYYYRNNSGLILCANQESKVGKPSEMNKENSKAKWTGLSVPIVSKSVYTHFKRWPHREVTIYQLRQEAL